MIYERFPNWDIDVEKGTIYSLIYKRYIGYINKWGYIRVKYPNYKQNGLHQFIWIAVNGDIPEGYEIHHIDGNPLNNSIYNLELVEQHEHRSEHKQNMSEETKKKIGEYHKGKPKEYLSKKVGQYTLNDELVKVWDSIREAERNGYCHTAIGKCCKGLHKQHKGYKWKYINDNKRE